MTTAELDLSSPFGRALARMWEVNRRKLHDYVEDPGVSEWQNFELVADQLGTTKDQAVEALIAVKQARMRSLRGKEPANESVQDTILDRAVYSAIALAMALEHEPFTAEHSDAIPASDPIGPPRVLKQGGELKPMKPYQVEAAE